MIKYDNWQPELYIKLDKYFNNNTPLRDIIANIVTMGETNYNSITHKLARHITLQLPKYDSLVKNTYKTNKHLLKVLLLYIQDKGKALLTKSLQDELNAINKRLEALA